MGRWPSYGQLPQAANTGWECPRCHRINAPSVKSCDCHDPMGAIA